MMGRYAGISGDFVFKNAQPVKGIATASTPRSIGALRGFDVLDLYNQSFGNLEALAVHPGSYCRKARGLSLNLPRPCAG
jgi:hypothetical protein